MFKDLKPILQSKKNPKVTDPIRFPNVVNGYENEFKRNYAEELGGMVAMIGKELVEDIK